MEKEGRIEKHEEVDIVDRDSHFLLGLWGLSEEVFGCLVSEFCGADEKGNAPLSTVGFFVQLRHSAVLCCGRKDDIREQGSAFSVE